jgi:hypothetical protein
MKIAADATIPVYLVYGEIWNANWNRDHRVKTYRAVTDRRKVVNTVEAYVFMYRYFVSGNQAKNDQLRVFSKLRKTASS